MSRTWPLHASSVAVLGVGNVALDIARVLAKSADELLTTEIPDNQLEGVYVTGWIKRGPVGLIGHTKGDAAETVTSLLADAPNLPSAPQRHPGAVEELLAARRISYTIWDGWLRLDAHERALGTQRGRDRMKVVEHEEMVRISRG